jgi:hypothetical protein
MKIDGQQEISANTSIAESIFETEMLKWREKRDNILIKRTYVRGATSQQQEHGDGSGYLAK